MPVQVHPYHTHKYRKQHTACQEGTESAEGCVLPMPPGKTWSSELGFLTADGLVLELCVQTRTGEAHRRALIPAEYPSDKTRGWLWSPTFKQHGELLPPLTPDTGSVS